MNDKQDQPTNDDASDEPTGDGVPHEPEPTSGSEQPSTTAIIGPPAAVDYGDQVPGTGDIGIRLQTEKPEDKLRSKVVWGIGVILLTSLAFDGLGLGFHWFTEDFAKLVLQVLVGPLLGAASVVVGYLFGERGK